MDGIDFSLLDVPRQAPVDDPETYLRTAIAWHFGEETGSPFWLRTAKTLDFDPLTASAPSRICVCSPTSWTNCAGRRSTI